MGIVYRYFGILKKFLVPSGQHHFFLITIVVGIMELLINKKNNKQKNTMLFV